MTQPNHQTTTGYNQNKPVEEMTDPAEKLMLVSKVSLKKIRENLKIRNRHWPDSIRRTEARPSWGFGPNLHLSVESLRKR